MAMIVSKPKNLNADPNITPLIDVLLVLLIIFMVIVPVAPRGLEAVLPRPPKPGQPAPSATIVVRILATPAGPTYKINNETILTKAELSAELNRIFSIRAERVLFVQGDPRLHFSSVAAVMDLSRAAGIDHIALLTPAQAAN